MTFAIHPGPLAPALDHAYHRLTQCRFAEALWTRRLDVWSGDAVVQQTIASRLGWLRAADAARPQIPRLRAFSRTVWDVGFTDIVLLGMGGSSLASEVLRAVIGVAADRPRFHVLDSVDPEAVTSAMGRAATTMFILASKSGSTIEVTTLAAEAERRVASAGVPEPGRHFVAITDEGTILHERALERRYLEVFTNPSDIGGRFSALSLFGLVPAALMGVDLDGLVSHAESMAEACRADDPRQNPGLALGGLMAAAALAGRDKLTLHLPPRFAPLGLWIEQLVAESTGKEGRGILPVAGDDLEPRSRDDVLMVRATLAGHDPSDAKGGSTDTPAAIIEMLDVAALGAEFFRWEVATAAAGLLLGINPFDEPNVQQAKDATRRLLAMFGGSGRLPLPDAASERAGARIAVTRAVKNAHQGDAGLRLARLLRRGDYFSLLAYVPPEDQRFAAILDGTRRAVAIRSACAATLGYGPRYLHSTGQLHKGGPNTGVFLIVTAEPAEDLAIPGEAYSFGVLEMAQAVGDFRSLDDAGRRAIHLHLPDRDPERMRLALERLLDG